MFAQRNQRIVRTGRREAALAAEIGAKDKLIAADKRRQQPRRRRHQLTRSRVLITTESSRPWSSTRSLPREDASRPSFRDLKLTSTLRGENAARWTRKVSLTNLLIRLRATEDLISRFGTDIAIAPNFPASWLCVGENRHSKSGWPIRFPDFNMANTSACFNRFRRGNGNKTFALKNSFP